MQRLKQSVTYRGAAAENGTRLADQQVGSSRGQPRGNQQRRPGDLTWQASSQVEADPNRTWSTAAAQEPPARWRPVKTRPARWQRPRFTPKLPGRGFFPFPFFYPTQIRNLCAASDQDTSCVQIRVAKQILIDSSTYFLRLE